MRLLFATRCSAKTCLNPSLLRPPIVSSINLCSPRHLVRASLRPPSASFRRTFAFSSRSHQQPTSPADRDREADEKTKSSVSEKPQRVGAEKIWTIPNILTISRILSCPALGYAILYDHFYVATALLVYAGLTDFVSIQWSCFTSRRSLTCFTLSYVKVDGYLARKYNMGSVLGTILDPAADKALVTTLVVTLTVRGLVPRTSAHT